MADKGPTKRCPCRVVWLHLGTGEKMASGWMTREGAEDLLKHGHWARRAYPMIEDSNTQAIKEAGRDDA